MDPEIVRLRTIAEMRFNRMMVLGRELTKANRALERKAKAAKRALEDRRILRMLARQARHSDYGPEGFRLWVQRVTTEYAIPVAVPTKDGPLYLEGQE